MTCLSDFRNWRPVTLITFICKSRVQSNVPMPSNVPIPDSKTNYNPFIILAGLQQKVRVGMCANRI